MSDSHFDDPIDHGKPLSGSGRQAWEVPPEVQQKVIDIIIEEAHKLGFDNRDLAYYIAIAKRESQFNPDAANKGGTASGIAQVIDATAATYGINDGNRFDARASIKAGLSYFRDLKAATVRDFGAADGKFEPLVYYRYHYGENSTRSLDEVPQPDGRKPKKVWHVKPFAELEQNKRYPDSKTVVDEAARIEAILNATHGLVIQLQDVMGKPMAARKVIAVVKRAKSSVPPASASAPATASAPPAPVEWELQAHEVSTDADGKLPEISSDAKQAVMILIPRIDVEAYNDAVSKNQMPEDGNEHVLLPHDAESAADAPPAPDVDPAAAAAAPAIDPNAAAVDPDAPPASDPASSGVSAPAAPSEQSLTSSAPPLASSPSPVSAPAAAPAAAVPVAPAPPAKPASALPSVFSAAAADAHAKARASAAPAPGHDITFEDVVNALKQHLGWSTVYQTSFSYMKQFYTRPKLPAAPLDQAVRTQPSAARTQIIGSSLHNKDAKKLKVESQVQTAEAPVAKPVSVSGDASWMPYAIKEQSKEGAEKVTEKAGSQRNDPQWKEQHAKRDAAARAQAAARKQLKLEQGKAAPDGARVGTLQGEIAQQDSAYRDADAAMLKIEGDYNNPDIVKYLQSTTLGKDMARDDDTAWCASFTNWVMEQGGYKGTDNALAESWSDWGQALTEPRYGCVTVVTRSAHPTKYHVGFYLGQGEMNVPDGEEPVKDKQGQDTGKKKKKFKKVKALRLLSGNFSNMVKEATYWAIDAGDCEERHLVSYRWPRDKDKQ